MSFYDATSDFVHLISILSVLTEFTNTDVFINIHTAMVCSIIRHVSWIGIEITGILYSCIVNCDCIANVQYMEYN